MLHPLLPCRQVRGNVAAGLLLSSRSSIFARLDLHDLSFISSSFILFCSMIDFLVIFSPGRLILRSHGSHWRKTNRTWIKNNNEIFSLNYNLLKTFKDRYELFVCGFWCLYVKSHSMIHIACPSASNTLKYSTGFRLLRATSKITISKAAFFLAPLEGSSFGSHFHVLQTPPRSFGR